MEKTLVILIFLGVAAADGVLAFYAHKQGSEKGRMFAGCLICAATITVFYLASILSINYFTVSLTSSIYFCFIDLMLLYLLHFFYDLIGIDLKNAPHMRLAHNGLRVLVAADCISLMLNPFTGHVIAYKLHVLRRIAPYAFEPLELYGLHLVLCYIMIFYGFVLVVNKAIRVPRLYRSLYIRVVACVLIVVALNAIYLSGRIKSNIDVSIITYSILGFCIYATVFVISDAGVLNRTREIILTNSNQPILIFDYNGLLFYSNSAAKELFDLEPQDEHYPLRVRQFAKTLNVEDVLANFTDQARFYWSTPGLESISYICDYQTIKDENQANVAQCFVFTNNTLGVDPLTGFQTEQYFKLHDADLKDTPGPSGTNATKKHKLIGVAVCDLNQLSLLNNILGYEYGDRAIALQAKLLRKYMPARSVFIRMRDAKLGVVCYNLEQPAIKARLQSLNEELEQTEGFTMSLKMDFAICMLDEHITSVNSAAAHAISILKTRKLLDRESNHSATIDALSNMLMECDSETESHVRRTRMLGDSLAFDIGLTDYERDQLNLLCLFHDIGKIGIPLNILNKPGPLTDAEWDIMRDHVNKGYRIARSTPGLEIVADPILHHHENWDGTGYPDGLEGEAIPILSRMISVIDAYDAMISDRPYRKGVSSQEACDELLRCAGTQFDPYLAETFVNMIKERESGEENTGVLRAVENRNTGKHTTIDPALTDTIAPAKAAMINRVVFTRYIMDAERTIIEADAAFEKLTGYTAYDVEQGLSQNDLIFEEDRETYWNTITQIFEESDIGYLEHRVRCKDGTGRYVYCMGYTGVLDGKPITTIVVTDITDSISVQHQVGIARNRAMMSLRRLEETVRLDPLTNLLNKSAFRKACEHTLLEQDEMCVMVMLDIDYFKAFNDTLGHPAGDELLALFAKTLATEVGSDGFAGRVGGDEFACLLKFERDTPLEDVTKRLNTIHETLNDKIQRFALGMVEPWPSVSAGAVLATPTCLEFSKLYELADEQLYTAKRSGKDRVCTSWEK